MIGHTYILDDCGNPQHEPDPIKWAHWFEKAERHIGDDDIGESRVSTVFLGIDHSFGQGSPVLWETMIFGGPHDQYQKRYTSKKDALKGHARALALLHE